MPAEMRRLPVRRAQVDITDLKRELSRLQEGRQTWDNHWQEVKDRVWPDAADFIGKREPGSRRTEKMYDATAALALEKFAAAVESLLTPRQQRWHKLAPADNDLRDDSEVKAWLELATDVLFQMRSAPESGFYSQAHEGYKSLGAFGNTCTFIEAREGGGARYSHESVSRVYVALNQHGIVDTVYRCRKLTAKQAFQRWGEKAPAPVKQALMRDPWQEHEYVHVVRPNQWRDPAALGPRAMAWESIHACLDHSEVIETGGYHQLPYVYSRYTVNPDETYGRSPAMLVLANIKTLNEMQKTFLRSGHRVADPPLLLHDDGALGTGGRAIRLKNGGLNYGGLNAQGEPMIKPLVTNARLDITIEMAERERTTINDAFLVSLFQILVDHPQMTATEALIRAQEKGQLLAPAIGRQQSEMLGPMIDRELWIAIDQGLLPPPPPQLLAYEIEYDSPATQMQKAQELVGLQRTVEIAAPFLTVDPGLFMKFKPEIIIQRAAEAQGVPLEMLRTDDEYAEARAQHDQAQAAARAVELAGGVGKAARDFAGAQAEMPTEGGPAGIAA